jgi:hypothetical protein
MATSNKRVLTLNDANSAEPVKISENDILLGVTVGSNTNITYKNGSSSINKTVTVTDTIANIAGSSNVLLATLTATDGGLFLLNSERVLNVANEGSTAALLYDMNAAAPKKIALTDTEEEASILLLGSPVNYEVATYTASTIVLAAGEGDVTGIFTAAKIITIVGSGANDGTYSVASSAFGAATTITLTEAIVDTASTSGAVTL